MNLLEVQNLKVHFPVKHGVFSRVRSGMRDFFLDGGDMKRVERVDAVALADDHNHILAHGDKFRMRHREYSPIGQVDRKRFETVGDHFPNPLNVHGEIFTHESGDVNRGVTPLAKEEQPIPKKHIEDHRQCVHTHLGGAAKLPLGLRFSGSSQIS